MEFKVTSTDKITKARKGTLVTGHGKIETPVFMPVGTAGTVKGVHQRELRDDIKAQIILGNTYHLYLRPGINIIESTGGLHRFTGWEKPMLTDSGGYQVYSLADTRTINEDGVTFRSHIDGSTHFFTPESVIDIQRAIGADIIMAFDECTKYPSDYEYAKTSMDITHRWLARCCKRFDDYEAKYEYEQTIFPIVQGSIYKDLRIQSAEVISSFEREGNAIGGLSVGEPAEAMYEMTEIVCTILPREKPRYLMGVGTPANILECISLGIDMFDCVMPTRNGRNGMLFTGEGIINIRNEKWKNDHSPVDPAGTIFADINYTKAYLRHLFVSKEMLGPQIASLHNLAFYSHLMKEAREQIAGGTFSKWKKNMVAKLDKRI